MGRITGKGRVLVALSGGVDSSCALYLLKKAGYECIAATIKTWPKDECGDSGLRKICCSLDAIESARAAARRLSAPHFVFDMSSLFRKRIRDYMAHEYSIGRTPNPCIRCNDEIKFGALFEKADLLGCDFIATGHYARISYDKAAKKHYLRKGLDRRKDQSYFVFSLDPARLGRILFPLGGMTKERTRQIAQKIGLKNYGRQSSQDICFKINRPSDARGDIIFSDGTVLGRHKGVSSYTIGQRKGLGVGFREPLYVTGIDAKKNHVYVGLKKDTLKSSFIADGLFWPFDIKFPARASAKVRYADRTASAKISSVSKGAVRVDFTKPHSSPTPGQAAVFYRGDRVIGGAWIKEVIC